MNDNEYNVTVLLDKDWAIRYNNSYKYVWLSHLHKGGFSRVGGDDRHCYCNRKVPDKMWTLYKLLNWGRDDA